MVLMILVIVVVLAVLFLIVFNINLASRSKKAQRTLQQNLNEDQVEPAISDTVQAKRDASEVSEVDSTAPLKKDQEYRQALRSFIENENVPKQEEKKSSKLRDQDYRASLRAMKDKK
jgi:cell division protein FtsX